MQKFDSPAPVSAVLDLPAGRIRLIAADRTDTTVEVLPADPTKNRDVKAAQQIEIAHHDGVLRIEAPAAQNRLLGHSGSVEVTVQLPAGSRVQAKGAATDLRGVGRLGDVAFDAAQGTVKLDETGSARLTLLAGDITVGSLGGPAEISTQRVTSASPRPCPAPSHCAPSRATSPSPPPTASPPPSTPAPATAGSTTPSRTPTAPPPA